MMRPCSPARVALLLALTAALAGPVAAARSGAPAPQKIDEAYSAKIQEYTTEPRLITELVDHIPASATVPSPQKVLGVVIGEPGRLTYYKDIVRYFDELAKASPRVKVVRIGKSDEGRDYITVAIADEATIRSLDRYKDVTAKLTDPRKISDAQARQLIAIGKPIYYATGSIHSPETGSPEMLMELGYRLAVEESPFVQQIRNNIIVCITPATEVDGRDKVVDTYYYRKDHPGKGAPPVMYWGKYVAHDNNRDAMGLSLKLMQNMIGAFLDWHPTVWHDLHESVPYLYTSTGTGPYNVSLDPIVVDEWWLLAKHETNEMTKRGLPGVWTYGFYDGWVPNYLFFIANTHNSIGRFYETQGVGPDPADVNLGPTQTSREWFRPNPPLPKIKWSIRDNINYQQSALMFAMNYVARNKETFLENYYLKNKRAIERGKSGPVGAWVIPAKQRRPVEAAELVNLLRKQGAEVHTAGAAFSAGGVEVAAGDYIVRMDQPYSTVVDMLLNTQYYAVDNPRPYDDTGWSFPLLRNVKAVKVADKSILSQPMTVVTADAKVMGGLVGSGRAFVINHNTDNTLATFRFRLKDVKMLAAEEPFEAAGQKFAAGSFIIPDADEAKIAGAAKELGLTAYAMASGPTVKAHPLQAPRIALVHTWTNTQNEGWVRLSFENYGIPFEYIADQKLPQGNLRSKYDVIVFPDVGGTPQATVNGLPLVGDPIPYKKTEKYQYIGIQDSSDDIRGGMGLEGIANLQKFVQEGGLLITEGSTSEIPPTYGMTTGVTVEEPQRLIVRGSVVKSLFADKKSPIAYGYDDDALAVYFNQAPVLSAAGGIGAFGGRRGGNPFAGDNRITPNAGPQRLATLEPAESSADDVRRRPEPPRFDEEAQFRQMMRQFGFAVDEARPRVILKFAPANDLLLSGMLGGGDELAGRAAVVDAPVGKGHIVLFANRPFWRWETQGSMFLAFNAILNYDHLDAGKEGPKTPTTTNSPEGQ